MIHAFQDVYEPRVALEMTWPEFEALFMLARGGSSYGTGIEALTDDQRNVMSALYYVHTNARAKAIDHRKPQRAEIR